MNARLPHLEAKETSSLSACRVSVSLPPPPLNLEIEGSLVSKEIHTSLVSKDLDPPLVSQKLDPTLSSKDKERGGGEEIRAREG